MATYTTDKHSTGCYRTRRTDGSAFGQVKQTVRGEWVTEIRNRDSGDMIRHAGIWNTMKDALEEAQRVLEDVRYTRDQEDAR